MRFLAVDDSLCKYLTDEQWQMLKDATEGHHQLMRLDDISVEQNERIEIVFGAADKNRVGEMQNLLWLQLPSAGVESHNDRGIYANDAIVLTNSSGVYGEPLSEHILAFLFGFARQTHRYRDHMKRHEWKRIPVLFDVHSSTIVIVGLGDIGLTTAKKCKALGMHVIGIKRSQSEKPDCVDELYFDMEQSLDKALQRADVVALCLPNTAKTKGVMDSRRLALMKEGAVLINIGRGSLVDQDALITQLQGDRIFAGLDVTTPEPLPESSPLWDCENCWITPHMAGLSQSRMADLVTLFLYNYERFIKGKTLDNIVDFTEGY